jgi:hypothetical protein
VAPATADQLERAVLSSRLVAWATIVSLPALGFLAALYAHLPLFAGAMAYAFLLAGALVCRRAVTTFMGKTLRLLVAARLVIILVVGALLYCTSGSAWSGVVAAVLLWLTADRLLGRRALLDVWKLTRKDTSP